MTATAAPITQSNDPFLQALNGLLYGVMSWEQLTRFWTKVDTTTGWYLYAVGEPVPEQTADATHVKQFITEIDALLRREHLESYCGIVYADDLENPTFIKIYDPNNLGVSCGSSKHPPLPGWVMSQIPPSLLETRHILPQGRKRWWQGFLDSLK